MKIKAFNKGTQSRSVQSGGTTMRVTRKNRKKGTANFGKQIFTRNEIYRVYMQNKKDGRHHFFDCRTKKAVDNALRTYRSKNRERGMDWTYTVQLIKLK